MRTRVTIENGGLTSEEFETYAQALRFGIDMSRLLPGVRIRIEAIEEEGPTMGAAEPVAEAA